MKGSIEHRRRCVQRQNANCNGMSQTAGPNDAMHIQNTVHTHTQYSLRIMNNVETLLSNP